MALSARISCPIYGFYGGIDNDAARQVTHIGRYMLASQKIYEPIIYREVGRGFMLKDQEISPPLAKAQDQAWERLMQVIIKHSRPIAHR